MTRSKGTQAVSQTQVHCSEDKASAHGTPALPTELNGAQQSNLKGLGSWELCSVKSVKKLKQ